MPVECIGNDASREDPRPDRISCPSPEARGGRSAADLGDAFTAARLLAIADQARESLSALFWDERLGWLADVVGPDGSRDLSLRPNQLFALSLHRPVVTGKRAERALLAIEERLLTPVRPAHPPTPLTPTTVAASRAVRRSGTPRITRGASGPGFSAPSSTRTWPFAGTGPRAGGGLRRGSPRSSTT